MFTASDLHKGANGNAISYISIDFVMHRDMKYQNGIKMSRSLYLWYCVLEVNNDLNNHTLELQFEF